MIPQEHQIGLAVRYRARCMYIDELRDQARNLGDSDAKNEVLMELINALKAKNEIARDLT